MRVRLVCGRSRVPSSSQATFFRGVWSWYNFYGHSLPSTDSRRAVVSYWRGERGGSVVECRTPEREVRGSKPTAAVLCPWARHFTPRKYWLITQEAMAPSRHDWKIVDWDVKPQHNQPTKLLAKECVLSNGKSLGCLLRNSVDRLTHHARNDLKCVEGP